MTFPCYYDSIIAHFGVLVKHNPLDRMGNKKVLPFSIDQKHAKEHNLLQFLDLYL